MRDKRQRENARKRGGDNNNNLHITRGWRWGVKKCSLFCFCEGLMFLLFYPNILSAMRYTIYQNERLVRGAVTVCTHC